jgi:hypothetical protein
MLLHRRSSGESQWERENRQKPERFFRARWIC